MSNAAVLACYREQPLELDEGPINGEMWSNFGGLYRLYIQAQTPGHEVAYGLQWLMSVLSGDATLRGIAVGGMWRNLAPPSTAIPFVIVAFQAGRDTLTMNAVRLLSQVLYQVKIVGPASLTPTLIAGANEIDAVLGRTSGAI